MPRDSGACGSITTVFVTAISTITETVESKINHGYSLVSTLNTQLDAGAPSMIPTSEASPSIITTHTIFETITRVISTIESTPEVTSTTVDEGPFFFTVHNGTTAWLGGHTPTQSISYVIETSTVFIQPVPSMSMSMSMGMSMSNASNTDDSQVTSTEEIHSTSTSTSTKTIEVTSFITEHLTETITVPSSSSVSGAASASLGNNSSKYHPYGWNATTTFKTISIGSGSGITWPGSYATGNGQSVTAPHPMTSLTAHSYVPSGLNFEQREAQVGAMVTATIDGVVVSWTNIFDGAQISASATADPSPTTKHTSLFGMSQLRIFWVLQSLMQGTVEPTLTLVSVTSGIPPKIPVPINDTCTRDLLTSTTKTMGSSSSIPTAGAVPFGPPHLSHQGYSSIFASSAISAHPSSHHAPTGTSHYTPHFNASATRTRTASAPSATCSHEAIAKGNFTINAS